MSQSSIDSFEHDSKASFCFVEQAQDPYANVETTIPSLIEAQYRPPHPHDEPSTADEGEEEEGDLILQSAGSSSDDSNRFAPPSVNASEIASNVSVSTSSFLGGAGISVGSSKKGGVVVETTTEQSALGTDPEEITFDAQFQVPDNSATNPCQGQENGSMIEPFVNETMSTSVPTPFFPPPPIDETARCIGNQPGEIAAHEFTEIHSEETSAQDATKNDEPRVKWIKKCLNPVTGSVVAGASVICLMMMTISGTQRSAGERKEPTMKTPLHHSSVLAETGNSAEFERLMRTNAVSTTPLYSPIDTKMSQQSETDSETLSEGGLQDESRIGQTIDITPWKSFEDIEEILKESLREPPNDDAPVGNLSINEEENKELLDESEEAVSEMRQAPIDGDELDDILALHEEDEKEVVEDVPTTASDLRKESVEPSSMTKDEPPSPASDETSSPQDQDFLSKSGEWLMKVFLILMSSFLFAKFTLTGKESDQGHGGDCLKAKQPPSSSDVCNFICTCRHRLKRSGRCRRSRDQIVNDKADFYDCYTKDDLYAICQFLNVANLSKVSRRGKNFMVDELVHGYEDLLWGFTIVEIKSILQVHGVSYKSNTNKATLVELAVEAAF